MVAPLSQSAYEFLSRLDVSLEYTMQVAVGYFDESSDEDTAGVAYTVAGFVGNNHATAVLDMRWRDLLSKHNLDYFKASELNSGNGQFRQFRDEPDRLEFTPFSEKEKKTFREIKSDFTDAILGCEGLSGIGAVVVLPDYEQIRKDYPPAKTGLSFPYFICASMVLMELGVQFNRLNQRYRPDERMRVRPVFDSHEEYSGRMKQGFDRFCKMNPISARYLLPPHYENDKEYLSLQAADDLAFELRKALFLDRANMKERIPMTRLRESGMFLKVYKLDYNGLKLLADAHEADFNPLEPIQYTLEDILQEHEK
jgi:hypothetical protein